MAFKQKKSRREVTDEMKSMLRRAGSSNMGESLRATRELVVALELPLQSAILKGDLASGVFDRVDFEPDAPVEFPTDAVGPGEDGDFVAYTASPTGAPHQRVIDGDSISVNTVDVRNSIDIRRKYAKRARWDVLTRAMRVCEAGHVYKNNIDAFSTVIAAGLSRNFLVTDSAATVGVFSPKLVATAITKFRRLGGGNTASTNRYRLSDILMSVEAGESVLGWDATMVDDYTRRTIIISAEDTGMKQVFGIDLHTLDELGVGQEFQQLFASLGGSHTNSKTQIAIGLDLVADNTFVNPVREDLKLYEDMTAHRHGMISMYSETDRGYADLDSRGTMLLQL